MVVRAWGKKRKSVLRENERQKTQMTEGECVMGRILWLQPQEEEKKKKGKAFWFTSSFSLQRTAVFHPISLSEDTMNKSVSNSVVPFPCFPHLTLRLSSSAPEETCAWHSSSVDLDQLLKHVPCNVKKNSHKKMILFYISSLSHL